MAGPDAAHLDRALTPLRPVVPLRHDPPIPLQGARVRLDRAAPLPPEPHGATTALRAAIPDGRRRALDADQGAAPSSPQEVGMFLLRGSGKHAQTAS